MGYGHTKASLNDANNRLSIKSRGDTAPPGGPAGGDIYLIGTSATGAWSGKDGNLAIYNADSSAWEFEAAPPDGLSIYVEDEKEEFAYDGNSLLPTSITADIHASYATDSNPYVVALLGATYASQGTIFFHGSDALGVPAKIFLAYEATASSPAHSIRIYDPVADKVIAEKTGLTTAAAGILDMGTLSNIPTGNAVFHVETKRDAAGSISFQLCNVSIGF